MVRPIPSDESLQIWRDSLSSIVIDLVGLDSLMPKLAERHIDSLSLAKDIKDTIDRDCLCLQDISNLGSSSSPFCCFPRSFRSKMSHIMSHLLASCTGKAPR